MSIRAIRMHTTAMAVIAAIGAAASQPCAAQEYALTDLGTLPGNGHSKALDINNSGEVVGYSTDDLQFGPDRAFLWRAGSMDDIGTLGGPGARATAINDATQIVGYADITTGLNPPRHAFRWESGIMQDLGTLGGNESWGLGVGESGEVFGGSRLVGGVWYHAFVWRGTQMQDLGTLPGHSASNARRCNSSNQIVGWSSDETGNSQAFVIDGGAMQDLGTLSGGCCADALDINSFGEIAGLSWINGTAGRRAVIWRNGMVADLGTLPGGLHSQAYAINDQSVVVGESWTTQQTPGEPRAFVWENGVMRNLNDLIPAGSGWTLVRATAINDLGQIVGYGTVNSRTHAFLLTPTSCPGDLNGDRQIDLADLGILLADFGCAAPGPCVGDLDGDGDTDLADLGILLANFGMTCP